MSMKIKKDDTEHSGDSLENIICVKKVNVVRKEVTRRFRFILSIYMDKLSIELLTFWNAWILKAQES